MKIKKMLFLLALICLPVSVTWAGNFKLNVKANIKGHNVNANITANKDYIRASLQIDKLTKQLERENTRAAQQFFRKLKPTVNQKLDKFVAPGKNPPVSKGGASSGSGASQGQNQSQNGSNAQGGILQQLNQVASTAQKGGSGAGAGGSGSGAGGLLGGLLGKGGSLNNANFSSGLGGMLNKAYKNLFTGSGFGSKVGNFLNNFVGPNTTSGLSNLVKNVQNMLAKGIDPNGNFSGKLFLFNNLWNGAAKFLMKKAKSFLDKISTKIKDKLGKLIQKIPAKKGWFGKILKKIKDKAMKSKGKLVDKLKAKVLALSGKLLAKSKGKVQKKLGI